MGQQSFLDPFHRINWDNLLITRFVKKLKNISASTSTSGSALGSRLAPFRGDVQANRHTPFQKTSGLIMSFHSKSSSFIITKIILCLTCKRTSQPTSFKHGLKSADPLTVSDQMWKTNRVFFHARYEPPSQITVLLTNNFRQCNNWRALNCVWKKHLYHPLVLGCGSCHKSGLKKRHRVHIKIHFSQRWG